MYKKNQTILLFPDDTSSPLRKNYFLLLCVPKAGNKGDIAREGLHPALVPFILQLILLSFILGKELNESSLG